MRSLTIDFDVPKIEINGIVFELQKSDADVMKDAILLANKYRRTDLSTEDAVLEALGTICGYVDTILGEGAMKKISGGRPIGVNKALECMTLIAREAARSYSDTIAEDYEE